MNTESLTVTAREHSGKGVARKLRAAGNVPAVVYGGGRDAMPLTLASADFDLIFRRTRNRNTIVSLDGDGGGRLCLVKDVQRHPVSRDIIHIDFYEVDADREVEVRVDVKPKGAAVGVKMGGRLQTIRRDLMVRCKPADIPSLLEVDVTELEIGKFAKVSQVDAPDGVTILFKSDFNLYSVIGKRVASQATED